MTQRRYISIARKLITAVAVVVFVATAGPLPAASSNGGPVDSWMQYQYAGDGSAVFAASDWDVAWRADIGKKSNGGISVVGDTAYIDSFDHSVYAFDAKTGKERWHRKLPNVLMNTPLVVAGIVIVGTGTGQMLQDSPTLPIMGTPQGDAIYALDSRDGHVLWSFKTVGQDMPTGVLVTVHNKAQFVFANGDDHIYGLDVFTGQLLWKQKVLGVNGMASLKTVNGLVYGISTMGDAGFFELQIANATAGDAWSHTYAIDPSKNGQFLWMAPYGVADASVTIGNGLVFTQGFRLEQPRGAAAALRARQIGWGALMNTEATFRTVITALKISTGEPAWQYVSAPGRNDTLGSAAFTSDSLFADGVVYAPLAFSKQFAALDASSGKPKWLIHTEYAVKAAPVLKDGLLFFGDAGANLYVVRASNGTTVHQYQFPGPPGKWGFAKSPPVIVGNTLYISADRWLYALRVSDLERGVVSPEGAPPTLGPSGDWCMFDSECTTRGANGAKLVK